MSTLQQLHEAIILREDRISFITQQRGAKLQAANANDRKKFKTAEEIVRALAELDPTKNKANLQWLANMYADGMFRFEDAKKITKALEEFIKQKDSLEIKDINKYFSPYDLEVALKISVPKVSGKAQAKLDKGNSKRIFENATWLIIQPLTEEAAIYYGKNTKWCTAISKAPPDDDPLADPDDDDAPQNMFDEYNDEGPLYILIERATQHKWQVHPESQQFMDARDEPVTIRDVQRFARDREFFAYLLCTGYTPDYKAIELCFPKDNKQDQQLQAIIAEHAPLETVQWYCTNILQGPLPAAEPRILKEPGRAIWYAIEIMEAPWPAAEPAIIKDRTHILDYMNHCRKGRPWPEAEHALLTAKGSAASKAGDCLKYANITRQRFKAGEKYIAQSAPAAVAYADNILGGERFPAAEETIAMNAHYAVEYASSILQHPWPEAEKAIAKQGWASYNYAEQVLRGLFPAGEKAILEEPFAAARYAMYIMRARWPKAEQVALVFNKSALREYCEHFGLKTKEWGTQIDDSGTPSV